jgi:hypothetical protein
MRPRFDVSQHLVACADGQCFLGDGQQVKQDRVDRAQVEGLNATGKRCEPVASGGRDNLRKGTAVRTQVRKERFNGLRGVFEPISKLPEQLADVQLALCLRRHPDHRLEFGALGAGRDT